jgi:asparagine synthase (glutamine-hydrolysing)
MRQALAWGVRRVSPEAWNRMGKLLEPALPARWRVQLPGDKAHKLADILPAERPEDLYQSLVSHWLQPARIVLGMNSPGADSPPAAFSAASQSATLPSFAQKMMLQDMVTYLPDDILTKVDRATMAASLEGRVPLLDHRVIEFAARIPLSMKIRDGSSKWLLRQVLYRYVPKQTLDRPKMGFGVPIDAWLRGPLREWSEGLLAEDRLRREGFFQPAPIRQMWREHLAGSRNWQYYLWDVLMFQAWHEHWERA